jgi:hypothetical protein
MEIDHDVTRLSGTRCHHRTVEDEMRSQFEKSPILATRGFTL